MNRVVRIVIALAVLCTVSLFAQIEYSTGAVSVYVAGGCGGPDLPLSVGVAASFRSWYNFAGGFTIFSQWNNGDVWGSDFRDGTDMAADGGSDKPSVYFYNGHGICSSAPNSTTPDHIFVCGNFGTPNDTVIGTSSRWGNNRGALQFAFIDASCPMELSSLANQWFPAFQGLHVAIGHSGDTNHDTLNSSIRGSLLAAHTAGLPPPWSWFIPQQSVGDAWMSVGLTDVQSGVCAVAIAAGNDRNDAINRRENEFVKSNWSAPTPNWFAWKWVCS
jgi:hypothetical protein